MTLCANYYETGSVEIDEVHSENISSNAAYIALARTGGDPRFQPWIAITYQTAPDPPLHIPRDYLSLLLIHM